MYVPQAEINIDCPLCSYVYLSRPNLPNIWKPLLCPKSPSKLAKLQIWRTAFYGSPAWLGSTHYPLLYHLCLVNIPIPDPVPPHVSCFRYSFCFMFPILIPIPNPKPQTPNPKPRAPNPEPQSPFCFTSHHVPLFYFRSYAFLPKPMPISLNSTKIGRASWRERV